MTGGYDGSIRIKALMNHSQFDRGVRSMGNSVQTLQGALRKLAGAIGLAFGAAAVIRFGRESVRAASELGNAWIGLQSIVEGQGRSFRRAQSFIESYISDGLVPLTDAVTAYKNLSARGYNEEQIQKTMAALKDAAAFGRQSTYSLGEAVASAAEGLKNENSILVDNAGVTKNVAKMWDDYAKSIGTTANNLTQEQKIQAEVNGILEETKFQTGDAAKLVNTYSGQVAMLGFQFQQLKVAVGNALMPIVQAVLPGINAIISALLKLANVFAKVTALLFGKATIGTSGQVSANEQITSSSLAAADAADKLANSTAGAGNASKKAAKDMKGVLAGFDELNILADKASGNVDGAAGGIGDAGAGNIELPEVDLDGDPYEELEESISSLGELFVKTLDDMLAGIPALKQAFLDFAESFNDFNQKLYDAFQFPGVLELVEQLGRELAQAFNALAGAIDWDLWGRTLGAGLNLGLQFLTEFIYTFDWVNLGQRLADFINGLVYEVDWYDFGRLLWAQFKIALETFAGFFTGLDMPALAKAASNIIMGFFDEMENTIARIDWGEIGRQIAEFLNNIDWKGIIFSIKDALKELVRAGLELISGFISNADPEVLVAAMAIFGAALLKKIIDRVILPIAKQIASNLISKIAEAITSSGIVSMLESIGGAILGIGATIAGVAMTASAFFDMWNNGFSWAKEAVMLAGIALAAVGAVLLGVPATVAAIVAGIVAVVATAAVVIHEHWDEIKEAAINAWEAAKEAWSTAGEWFNEHVIEPVKEFFSGLWEGVTTLASGAWQGIQEIWAAVSGWFEETVITPVREFFTNLWENVTTFASDAWNNVQEIWGIVSSWFNENVITPVTEFFTSLWEDVTTFAMDAWQGIQDTWSSVSGWFYDNIVTPVGKFFGDMWDDINEKGGNAWETIQSVWKDACSWFEEHVTTPLGDAFEAVVSTAKNAVNGMIGAVEGMVNSVVKAVNWLIGQLNKIHFDVPDWVPAVGGRSFGFHIPNVSEVKLPRLANGAVIPPNQQFAAILGDQRSGANIETPLSTMVQAFRQALNEGGYANGNRNITVILQLDKREFGRAVYSANNEETQRVGVRLEKRAAT